MTSLDYIMEKTGIIGNYDSAMVMKLVGTALKYCHSKKMIHRDVKQHNILVDRCPLAGEKLKLGDFGLSTFHEDRTQCGTPRFMAPEITFEESYSYHV